MSKPVIWSRKRKYFRLFAHPGEDDYPMPNDEQLLVASFNLDFEAVKDLLADDACAGYQDPETGHGPLHKIVLAADNAKNRKTEHEPQEILEYLLANGAVWMQGIYLSKLF